MGEVAINDEPKAQIIVGRIKAEEREASKSGITDREFAYYLGILGISKKDLGKNVLDLGSGTQERFSRQASKLGIKVVSLNPKLALDDLSVKRDGIDDKGLRLVQSAAESRKIVRMDVEGLPPHQGRSVGALATHLPFRDNSFDSVVSVLAIPWHLSRGLYGEAFSEITRVLKSGGKAFMGPINVTPQSSDFLELKSVLDKNDNVSYSITEKSPLLATLTLTKK